MKCPQCGKIIKCLDCKTGQIIEQNHCPVCGLSRDQKSLVARVARLEDWARKVSDNAEANGIVDSYPGY